MVILKFNDSNSNKNHAVNLKTEKSTLGKPIKLEKQLTVMQKRYFWKKVLEN